MDSPCPTSGTNENTSNGSARPHPIATAVPIAAETRHAYPKVASALMRASKSAVQARTATATTDHSGQARIKTPRGIASGMMMAPGLACSLPGSVQAGRKGAPKTVLKEAAATAARRELLGSAIIAASLLVLGTIQSEANKTTAAQIEATRLLFQQTTASQRDAGIAYITPLTPQSGNRQTVATAAQSREGRVSLGHKCTMQSKKHTKAAVSVYCNCHPESRFSQWPRLSIAAGKTTSETSVLSRARRAASIIANEAAERRATFRKAAVRKSLDQRDSSTSETRTAGIRCSLWAANIHAASSGTKSVE